VTFTCKVELNLQVQLVPPQSRDRDRTRLHHSRTAMTKMVSATPPPTDLMCRCILITHPLLSSPLSRLPPPPRLGGWSSLFYNLQAHDVMTNVIVDAGTDVKVANFQKHGLEIVGLATLEHIEASGSNAALAAQILLPSNRASTDDHHKPIHFAIP
jgi:hypothetical protein